VNVFEDQTPVVIFVGILLVLVSYRGGGLRSIIQNKERISSTTSILDCCVCLRIRRVVRNAGVCRSCSREISPLDS